MFNTVRQMLEAGKPYCDVDGDRCTVAPKGFGTITVDDVHSSGAQERPSSYTWNSCLDEHREAPLITFESSVRYLLSVDKADKMTTSGSGFGHCGFGNGL